MESNGEPGLVNISADTYELIKDKFSCKYRGKIYAKNIGEIDMYFVDSGQEIVDNGSKAFVQNEGEMNNLTIEKEIEKFDLDSTYG
jgi:hypothetical protein